LTAEIDQGQPCRAENADNPHGNGGFYRRKTSTPGSGLALAASQGVV
jgi:hypothetical protein